MQEKQILFQVRKGVDENAHVFTAYSDGTTDGFGDGPTIVMNRWPVLLREQVAIEREAMKHEAHNG